MQRKKNIFGQELLCVWWAQFLSVMHEFDSYFPSVGLGAHGNASVVFFLFHPGWRFKRQRHFRMPGFHPACCALKQSIPGGGCCDCSGSPSRTSKPQLWRNGASGTLLFDYSCKSFGKVEPGQKEKISVVLLSRLVAWYFEW